MTYEQFKATLTEDAFRSVLNDDNKFKDEFMFRLSTPGYELREWEKEVFSRLMELSHWNNLSRKSLSSSLV